MKDGKPWLMIYMDSLLFICFWFVLLLPLLYSVGVMDEEGTKFKWQRGDVLVVDNMLALHSRNSFVPPRRILVAMTM